MVTGSRLAALAALMIVLGYCSCVIAQTEMLCDAGFELSNPNGTSPSSGYWNCGSAAEEGHKVTTTSAYAGNCGLWEYTGNGAMNEGAKASLYQSFAANPGEEFVASAWGRSRTSQDSSEISWPASASGRVVLRFMRNNVEISRAESSAIHAADREWRLLSAARTTAPGGTDHVIFSLNLEKSSSDTGIAVANFDNCSLVRYPASSPSATATPTATSSPSPSPVATPHSCPSGMAISLAQLPEYGMSGDIAGTVSGSFDPAKFHVAPVILVGDGWWSKPTAARPYLDLDGQKAFSGNVITGACDLYFSKITLFVAPAEDTIPLVEGAGSIPSSLWAMACASTTIDRIPPLQFAGYSWSVKSAPILGCKADPGMNRFSKNNTFVDQDGLHMRIAKDSDGYSCSEVILDRSLGYGYYRFNVRGNWNALDPYTVMGLFTFAPDALFPHKEIDIESSRWGNPSDPDNAQFVVQPHDHEGNRIRFAIPAEVQEITYWIAWQPGYVDYWAYKGTYSQAPPPGALIHKTRIATSDVPTPGNERIRINFWLYNAHQPTSDQEFTVSDFQFSSDGASAMLDLVSADQYQTKFTGKDSDGWTSGSASPTYQKPLASILSEGLRMNPGGSANAFGYWRSPPLSVNGGETLEIRWRIRSDVEAAQCPQMRLRVNEGGYRYASLEVIESSGDGALSPNRGETREYLQKITLPAFAQYIFCNLDLLSFNRNDDLNANIDLVGLSISKSQ